MHCKRCWRTNRAEELTLFSASENSILDSLSSLQSIRVAYCWTLSLSFTRSYSCPCVPMEFLYSDRIDSSTYKTDGLCDGIDLRRHSDPRGEIRGVTRCQKDWSKFIGPLRNYNGTLGDQFSFIGVTIPECLPERREIISYANEFAFLYDGMYIYGFFFFVVFGWKAGNDAS